MLGLDQVQLGYIEDWEKSMVVWVSNAVSTLWLHESYTGPTANAILQAFRVSPVHMH